MSKAALDALIAQIVATAAKEIAAAVRAQATSPPAPRPVAAAPKKPAAAEPAKPAANKPHPRRSYTDADIDGVLALITSKPGLRTEEIKAAIGSDDRAVEKILARLRETGRVKTSGVKRAMTYTAVGSGTGAQPRTAPKTKASRTAKKPRKAKTAVTAAGASLAATAKAPSTSVAGATVAFGGNPFGTDHAQMRNGSEYNGTLVDRSLQFAVEGSDDTIAIDTAQLVRLSINFVGDGKDQVLLRDGSESLGKVKTSALKFKTDTMGTLTLKVGQMLALQRLGNL